MVLPGAPPGSSSKKQYASQPTNHTTKRPATASGGGPSSKENQRCTPAKEKRPVKGTVSPGTPVSTTKRKEPLQLSINFDTWEKYPLGLKILLGEAIYPSPSAVRTVVVLCSFQSLLFFTTYTHTLFLLELAL